MAAHLDGHRISGGSYNRRHGHASQRFVLLPVDDTLASGSHGQKPTILNITTTGIENAHLVSSIKIQMVEEISSLCRLTGLNMHGHIDAGSTIVHTIVAFLKQPQPHIPIERLTGIVENGDTALHLIAIDHTIRTVAYLMGSILQVGTRRLTVGSNLHGALPYYIITLIISSQPDIPCSRFLRSKQESSSSLATSCNAHCSTSPAVSLFRGATGKQMNLMEILLTAVIVLKDSAHLLSVIFFMVAGERHARHRNIFNGMNLKTDMPIGVDHRQHIANVWVDLSLPNTVGSALADRYDVVGSFFQTPHGKLMPHIEVLAELGRLVTAHQHYAALFVQVANARIPVSTDSRPVDIIAKESVAIADFPVVHRQLISLGRSLLIVWQTHTNDGILTHVITVGGQAGSYAAVIVWSQDIKSEITVIQATPSPVHMEETVHVIAVEHKGMSTTHISSGESYRMAGGQFFVQEFVPASNGIITPALDMRAIVVTKIIHQRIHALGEAGRRRWSVTHLTTHSHPVHQFRYGLLLSIGLITMIVVEHVLPIDDRASRNVSQLYTFLALSGLIFLHIAWNEPFRGRRIAVVGHHLCNGRGHTPRCTTVTLCAIIIIVARTKQVVRMTLVP